MHKFIIYILQCSDESFYVGHTDNIEQRLSQHQLGLIPCYTTTRLPVKLVFMQGFTTRAEALIYERKIKKWNRIKKQALINHDWNLLTLLSKKKF
jgi:predicted GIY-YIG superfamily endonuclease